MSIELLEQAAAALGNDLNDRVVFVGAATLPLWITDSAAPPLRPTIDVDVVVEVGTLIAYNRFEQQLRRTGFRDEGTVLGRFLHENGLQIDAIPAKASILGLENRWLEFSLATAVPRVLPSDTEIRVLAPANLLATKLEAFADRGRNDFLGSPDFEDIVALLDGREEIVDEVLDTPAALRAYVCEQLAKSLSNPRAQDAISAHLDFGSGGPDRAQAVVISRISQIVEQ